MARQPKGRPSIYLGKDGLHHTWLTVGTKPSGKPDRIHIKRRGADRVAEAIEATQERLKQGAGKLAKIETLADWLHHFVHVILLMKRDSGAISWNTWSDYETICRVHLIPSLGHWRISGTKRRLEPEHVETMYALKVAPTGGALAASYVHRMHIYLGRALKTAYKRGRADRNVMDLVDPPPAADSRTLKIKPPPYRDACRLIGFALQDELAHRWLLGMIAGPRQGEVLGIRWTQVELDPVEPNVPPHIRMLTQVQRRKWDHGCGDPIACVRARTKPICRTKPCEPLYAHGCGGECGKKLARFCPTRRRDGDCYRHVDKARRPKPCPPLCSPDCAKHASTCPKRTSGGLVEADLKTHASEAPMVIGAAVAELLRAERERQIRAGTYIADGFVVQGHVVGKPMDPRQDYERWCALIKRAGMAHFRLHAGTRHLTGSTLSATGADLPMIRDILRQADTSVAAGYVALGLESRHEALEKVAAALIDGDISMILGARKVA